MKGVILAAACCWMLSSCTTIRMTRPWAPRMVKVTEVRTVNNATRIADGDLELQRLRRQVIEHPADTAARLKLAEHYEAMGMGELAIEHYRLAGEKAPGDEVAAYRHALAVRASDAAAARAGLRRFVTSFPVRRADTYSLLAILEDQAGDLISGEQLHREALKLAPKADGLHNNLGFNLLSQGKVKESVGEFRAALRIKPGSTLARNNMAHAIAALAGDEKPDESAVRLAFGHWKKAAGTAEAHNNVAGIYMKQGRYAEARKELEKAVRLQPDLGPAWRNLQQLSTLDGGRPEVAPVRDAKTKRIKLSERPTGSGGSGTPVLEPGPVTNRTEGEGPEKSLRETIGSGSEASDAKE